MRESTMPRTSSVTVPRVSASTMRDGETDWVPTRSENATASVTAATPAATTTVTGVRPPRPTLPVRWAGAAG